jgi:hypothetical protein
MSQFNLNRPSISNLDTYQHFNADPRQISPAHSGQTIDFDFPPQSNQITGQNMYSNVLDDYGSRYTSTYENITPGQMTYYVDKTICGPFFVPNFSKTTSPLITRTTIKTITTNNPPILLLGNLICIQL